MSSFEDFKKKAKDDSLTPYEKVGFEGKHRKDTEKNVFPDVLRKMSGLREKNKTVLEIGCGCSLPVLDLIACSEANEHKLILLDSKEMLDNLPDSAAIVEKAGHEFPYDQDFLQRWHNKLDVVICYSVVSIIYPYQNLFSFVDKALSLLSSGGQMLIGDIANVSKKKRYLSSPSGIEFHKQWSGDTKAPEVIWNEEYVDIDDSVIMQLVMRYRSMGMETYILPQPEGMPMNQTREDVLICKR